MKLLHYIFITGIFFIFSCRNAEKIPVGKISAMKASLRESATGKPVYDQEQVYTKNLDITLSFSVIPPNDEVYSVVIGIIDSIRVFAHYSDSANAYQKEVTNLLTYKIIYPQNTDFADFPRKIEGKLTDLPGQNLYASNAVSLSFETLPDDTLQVFFEVIYKQKDGTRLTAKTPSIFIKH